MLPLYSPNTTKPSFMASLTNRSTFLQSPFTKKQPQPRFSLPTHCFYFTRSQFSWLNTSPLSQLKKLNLSTIPHKRPQGLITHTSQEGTLSVYMTSSAQFKHCLTDILFQVTVIDVQTGRTSIQHHSLASLMLLFDGLVCAVECNFELNLIRISLFSQSTSLLLQSPPTQPQPQPRKLIESHSVIPYLLDSHTHHVWSYPALEEQHDEDEEESIYSCSSYSIIDDECYSDDYDYDEQEDSIHQKLSQLVQDTLNYIQSNGGAYTDELNNLLPKLSDYLSL